MCSNGSPLTTGRRTTRLVHPRRPASLASAPTRSPRHKPNQSSSMPMPCPFHVAFRAGVGSRPAVRPGGSARGRNSTHLYPNQLQIQTLSLSPPLGRAPRDASHTRSAHGHVAHASPHITTSHIMSLLQVTGISPLESGRSCAPCARMTRPNLTESYGSKAGGSTPKAWARQ